MRDRPNLIQSEGIFSEGLATLETKKQRREEPGRLESGILLNCMVSEFIIVW